MSFLVDPPLLVGAGAAIERVSPDERVARVAQRAVVAGFIGFSALLYVNAPGMAWFWRPLGATSGRDWMLNSGVLSFEHRRVSARTHALAAALFATYPLFPRLGRAVARRAS